MARPKVRIDAGEVEKLCMLQCTDVEVAAFIGVSVRTLERRKKQKAFAEAMERGRAKGRVSVRRHLYAQAAKGNVAAAIFLAKNLLGYRDVLSNEHRVSEGSEFQMIVRSVLDPKPGEKDAGHRAATAPA